MSEVIVENVGPVTKLTLPVLPKGGVVVIRGANGKGKSTVIGCLDAVSRNGKVSATPRDGTKAGTVRAFGVTIRVGSRVTTSGELEVEEISSDVRPDQIVDTGIADPARSEASRIRGLLRLAGITATPEEFQVVEGLRLPLPQEEPDAVELAKLAKAELQRLAREAENAAKGCDVRAEGIRQLGIEPDSDAPPVQHARQAMLDTAQHAEKVRTQRANYLKVQSQVEQAAPIVERADAARAELDQAKADADQVDQQVSVLDDEIRQLTVRRDALHQKRIATATRLASLMHEVRAAETAVRLIGELASAKPVDQDTVEACEQDAKAAEIDYERAVNAEKAAGNREAFQAHRAEAEGYRARATQLRETATHAINDVLSGLVERMADGWSVVDDVVCVRTDRSEHEPFRELSQAEKWLAVLRVVVRRVGGRSVVALPQEVWEGMDSATRGLVRSAAESSGVTLYVAEATDGDLEAVVAQEAAPAAGDGDVWGG